MFDDFMNPGKPPMTMMRDDGMIDMHDSPDIYELDKAMDPLGQNGGSQGHPAKPKQSRKMDFLG